MYNLDVLPVRFHYNGEFINTGRDVHYVGGDIAMSYIERLKVSLPEIKGHLEDHLHVNDAMHLHWIFPSQELSVVLRLLIDDEACCTMSDCTTEGGVADIYVVVTMPEGFEGSAEESDWEDELGNDGLGESEHMETEAELEEVTTPKKKEVVNVTPTKVQKDMEMKLINDFYRSPQRNEHPKSSEPMQKEAREKTVMILIMILIVIINHIVIIAWTVSRGQEVLSSILECQVRG